MKECDAKITLYGAYKRIFQSTHSMKECDAKITLYGAYKRIFQSTHSMKECDNCGDDYSKGDGISIHALYERVRLQW